MSKDRGWFISTCKAIPSTGFLVPFPWWVLSDGHWHVTQRSLHFMTIQLVPFKNLSQSSYFLICQSFSFQAPEQEIKLFHTMNLCIFCLGQLLIIKNMEYQLQCQKIFLVDWVSTLQFSGLWAGLFCISNIFSACTHVLKWPTYKLSLAFLLYISF